LIYIINTLIFNAMSLKKQSVKTRPECKVTFILAKEIAASVKRANLVGDFNDWDIESIPMIRRKSGELSATVNLATGKEYQFKYLLDSREWINDREADKYVPNAFQSENSVVVV
jgi:1,4-alpha-glucan branching enzyme